MLACCMLASLSPKDQSLPPYMSKLSFQYGFNVFLITEVVRVCSPDIVATAKGSGNPMVTPVSPYLTQSSLERQLTENIAFI